MLGRQFLRITRTASHGYFCQNSTSKFISELLTHNNFYHLTLTALLRTTSYTSVGYRIQDNLKDCYSLLNIKDGCSEEELKEAYIRLAKLYHPDSQTETADSKKFNQVKEAYKTIKRKIQADNNIEVVDDEDDDDDTILKWRAPQHRQFLSHEGIGSGTMSERQKQYEQLRVSQATDRIYKYRLKKLAPEGDNALVAKEKRAARTRKISKKEWYARGNDDENLKAQLKSNTIDRMVEDMILESMSKGSFDNLPGYGKPHKFSDKEKNPYLDKITLKLNQILIDDDAKPEWIAMQKEIRVDLLSEGLVVLERKQGVTEVISLVKDGGECGRFIQLPQCDTKLQTDLKHAREKLAVSRWHLADPPHSSAALKHWKLQEEKFHSSIIDINQRIDNFNLIVPILNKQMVHYDFDKEVKNIYCDCDKYIPPNRDLSQETFHYNRHIFPTKDSSISWKEIWKNIKDVFKT